MLLLLLRLLVVLQGLHRLRDCVLRTLGRIHVVPLVEFIDVLLLLLQGFLQVITAQAAATSV